MLRVLAAEMSDAARLARGKRYWSDQAVIDLHVGPGVATAEVQGSRRSPYVAVLRVGPGSGAPSRRDVDVACSCPDDDGTGIHACKHVVAALFALADEVSIEPEVLQRWRGGRPSEEERRGRRHGRGYDEDDEDDGFDEDGDEPGDEWDDPHDDDAVGFDEFGDEVDDEGRSWWSDRRPNPVRAGRLHPPGPNRSTGTAHTGAAAPSSPAVSPLAAELEELLGERHTPLPAPVVTPLTDRPPFPDPLVTAAVEEAIARLALDW
jgi:hypothetical protein